MCVHGQMGEANDEDGVMRRRRKRMDGWMNCENAAIKLRRITSYSRCECACIMYVCICLFMWMCLSKGWGIFVSES